MPGTVKSELLPDADRLHKCDGQEKVCEIQHLPLDKSHFITGYINYSDTDLDWRYIVVTGLDTQYSPKFQAYSVGQGKTVEMKIHKAKPSKYGRYQDVETSFADVPLQDGDVIYVRKVKKQAKQHKVDGKWQPIAGQYEWWIKDYYKLCE